MKQTDAILDAARAHFLRYGVGKTTMNDIAREAGVARQTVYNAYANKTEILRAVVRDVGEKSITQITTAWQTCATLDEKIDLYFTAGPLTWYDMISNSPDAAELLEGLHGALKVEHDEAAANWQRAFADLFRQHAPDYPDPDILADFFRASSFTAKIDASDRKTVSQRLDMLKKSTLALLGVA